MLYSPTTWKRITHIPHREQFDAWRAQLTDAEYEAVMAELDRRIEGTEIQTSSWMPDSSDWAGSVFMPLYEKACRRNQDAAGLFFGLLVWVAFLDRDDAWSFGRYEKDGIPIKGMTYFRIDHPK